MLRELNAFVIKRITFYFILIAIVIILTNNWYLLIGTAVGAVLSAFRFKVNAWIFKKQTGKTAVKSIFRSLIIHFLNSLILITIMFLFYNINQWLFAGLIAGALLAPFAIIVNSFTEVLGITNNNFFV